MENLKEETVLKLDKKQLQTVITDHLLELNGIHELFEMFVNGLMYCERKTFLTSTEENNKGNGFREVSKFGIGSKLQLRIPRDRLGVFQPMILGLLEEQEEQIKDLCFELYGKGLTTREIEDVVEKIYGKQYSKSSISRITTDFSKLIESWLERTLEAYYPIIYIDAIHIKVRRDTVSTEAFYVLLGLREDHTREVLGIVNIPQESATGWQEVLENLKQRGVQKVGLFVSDDLTGLSDTISKVYANSLKQKCVLHYMRNISKELRKEDKEKMMQEIKESFQPDNPKKTAQDGIQMLRKVFENWSKIYPKLYKKSQKEEMEHLFTYFHFDYRIRRMIYTTNWIERLNKSFRRTLKMRKALPSPESAITLLGFVAMEMTESSYSYPISNFRFDSNFAK